MAYEQYKESDLTLRDKLAIDRTRLANERTVLAYVRTAIMLIVAGATAIRLFGDSPGAIVTGWLFVAFGGAIGLYGVWRFVAMRRAIERVMPPEL